MGLGEKLIRIDDKKINTTYRYGVSTKLCPILENMTDDEIINLAIKEVNESEKLYKSFLEFSFMNGLDPNDIKFKKIRYMLMRAVPFEKHTENAIKLSPIGLIILNDYKDWFRYKKSLLPKKDYIKIGSFVIAFLLLIWNVFQGIQKNSLKDENVILMRNQDSLTNQLIQFKDSIDNLKSDINAGMNNSVIPPSKNNK